MECLGEKTVLVNYTAPKDEVLVSGESSFTEGPVRFVADVARNEKLAD